MGIFRRQPPAPVAPAVAIAPAVAAAPAQPAYEILDGPLDTFEQVMAHLDSLGYVVGVVRVSLGDLLHDALMMKPTIAINLGDHPFEWDELLAPYLVDVDLGGLTEMGVEPVGNTPTGDLLLRLRGNPSPIYDEREAAGLSTENADDEDEEEEATA